MRFSLRWLFGAMSLVGVACACLILSNSVAEWLGLALHIFLLLSVLGTFYAPRERRAFWGGCAFMGWYYLGSAYLPHSDLQPLRMTATGALREIYWKIARDVPAESPPDTEDEADETNEAPIALRIETPRGTSIPDDVLVFHEVGQNLATFLAAFVGGVVALWFDRRASCKPAGPSKEAAK